MTVTSGDQTIEMENVVIGDVWVMNGQSNMAFGLGKTYRADLETATAAGERCGKTQARNYRRFLDDHWCEAIDAVDHEVGRDRKWQPEHADDVLDDPVRRCGQQDVAAVSQRGGVLGRKQAMLFESVYALSDI